MISAYGPKCIAGSSGRSADASQVTAFEEEESERLRGGDLLRATQLIGKAHETHNPL